MLFAYFAPETALPLTSTLAAAVGFLLMFGRQVGRVTLIGIRRTLRLFPPIRGRSRLMVARRHNRPRPSADRVEP